MNSLPYVFRCRNAFSGVPLKNLKSLVIVSPRKTAFSSLCAPFKVNHNAVLQLPKPFSSVRLYAIPMSAILEPKKESHSGVWVTERIVSFGLLFSIPLILGDSSFEDAEIIVDFMIALHVHWGLEAIFKDYLRPSVVGPIIPKYCEIYAGFISIYLAVALLWITYYGIGVAKTIKHLWCLDPNIKE